MSVVVLLGPQRLRPTLRTVVADFGITGPIAAITAGWRERENEDDELAEHLEEQTRNLALFERAETAMAADPALFTAFREQRARRRQAQKLYRLRLSHALASVRALAGGTQPRGELAEQELAASFEVVRELDARHLARMAELEQEFAERWHGDSSDAVRRQLDEIEEILDDCQILAIAGGNVGVLTELLRLFRVERQLRGHSVLAWSAGAMALGRRVVLFHDSPPQGFGNAEVWGPGLGLYDRFLIFPHARQRLALDDPLRVSTVARRFEPQICVPMDEGDMLPLIDDRLSEDTAGRRLRVDGRVGELVA